MNLDRHPGLAARIDDIHRHGKSLLAAIGIIHMVGDQGVPALLTRRGFKVERISFGQLP